MPEFHHDQFTQQMRNRLKTIGLGLGLVRLLQDAGLTEEARKTLSSLENGFQTVAKESDRRSSAAPDGITTGGKRIRP